MAEYLRATKLCCQNCNSLTSVFDPNIPDLPSPNLSHLLGIDRVLSNEEQTLARDVAVEAGKRAAILAPQMDFLEKLSGVISKAHTELQIHREKLEKIKVEHQRLASSDLMRQMMPEILSEIFLYHQSQFLSLPEFFDLDHHSLRLRDPSLLMEPVFYNSFSLLYGPLLLTQICRRWRDVAISTPRIWTTIAFAESGSNLSQPSPNLVDLWMTRSCQLPLRIYIHETKRSTMMHKAILRLFHYSRRWEELYIASPNLGSRWQRFHAFRSRLPLLRVLVLHSWALLWPEDGDLDLFSDAPLLTQLTSRHFRKPWVLGFDGFSIHPTNMRKLQAYFFICLPRLPS
jgi:hypothetical protein